MMRGVIIYSMDKDMPDGFDPTLFDIAQTDDGLIYVRADTLLMVGVPDFVIAIIASENGGHLICVDDTYWVAVIGLRNELGFDKSIQQSLDNAVLSVARSPDTKPFPIEHWWKSQPRTVPWPA